jgi:predicted permease
MTITRLPASVRQAARRLRRTPGFTVAATLTLALGIGATTAAFSVVHAVLLRPLPFAEPDRLFSLSHTLVVGRVLQVEQSDASLLFYRRNNRTFADIGGYRTTAAALGPVNGADAERVSAAVVMAGFFPALRVPPVRGRVFTEADEQRGAPPVAMIGEGLWQRKFGGNAAVLNRPLYVDGVAHEIVGIVPESFRFPAGGTDVWLPLQIDPANTDSATFDYYAVARLREGVPAAAAAADLQGLLLRLPEELPGRLTRPAIERTQMQAIVRPLADVVVGDIGRLLWIVAGAAFFVLAIAGANVANLFFVRAEARRGSIGVERALGATPADVFLQFFFEGLLVAAGATVLGALLATGGVAVLQSLDSVIDLPRIAEIRVGAPMIALSGLAALAGALFASGLPALRLGVASMQSSLAGITRSATADRPRHRMRQALVIAQVALALVLLVGSGLMARSVWRLRAVQPGFEPAQAMTFRLALPAATYRTPDETVRFYGRVLDRIGELPGVRRTAAVSKLPLDEQGRTDTAVFAEDRPVPQGSLPGIHPVVYATASYFETAGIPLMSGRSFTTSDPPRLVHEVVVSRAFAERYWKGESPLGKRVRILTAGPWYTVVGEVGNVRDAALDRPSDEILYCPLLPAREDPRWSPRDLALIVRTTGSEASVAGAVRDVVRTLDPSLPIYRIRPFTDVVARAAARREITFILIGGASGVALVLGALGLFGVMSYVMALRTREIAIRLALGARPAQVRLMVAFQGLRAASIGVAIGLAGATLLTRFLAALLYEVSPTDPAVLALGAALLLAVAAVASWLPTRRTTRIDPASALRAE